MYRKILVPLDGSLFAEAALPLALEIVRKDEAELHLVTVVPTLPAMSPASSDQGPVKGWFEEERVRAKRSLDDMESKLREKGVAAPIHTRVLAGQPVAALDERIRKVEADLVVMTTHGRGRLERLWIGSVADGLVRSGPCPILLWRPREEDRTAPPPEIDEILIPLDGSDASAVILPAARSLARVLDARISLLTVFQRSIPLGSTYIPHAAQEEAQREEALDELRNYLEEEAGKLRDDGFEVETHVVTHEDPAEAILEHKRSSGADMVAMATRGHGGVARLVVGSVADKVIRAGTKPILVTRQHGR